MVTGRTAVASAFASQPDALRDPDGGTQRATGCAAGARSPPFFGDAHGSWHRRRWRLRRATFLSVSQRVGAVRAARRRTPPSSRDSGFKGVVDLLKIAQHGRGQNIYLVKFHYLPPNRKPQPRR